MCIYVYMCMCIYIHIYICIYVCVIIYIYIYTHTHDITNIAWFRFSGKLPAGLRIPPLRISIMLESNPLKFNVSREIGRTAVARIKIPELNIPEFMIPMSCGMRKGCSDSCSEQAVGESLYVMIIKLWQRGGLFTRAADIQIHLLDTSGWIITNFRKTLRAF